MIDNTLIIMKLKSIKKFSQIYSLNCTEKCIIAQKSKAETWEK